MNQRGIEDLIRETLTDPRRRLDPPLGHYQLVGERIGRARRQRAARWLGSAAAVVLLLTVGVLVVDRPHRAAPVLTGPSPTSSSPVWYGERQVLPRVGSGSAVAVAAAGGWFYVAEEAPGTVLRVDAASFAVAASTGGPERVEGLAVDATADRLWVWYSTPTGAMSAREYVASTLAPERDVTIGDAQVFHGTMLGGELWLGTARGLYRIGPSDTGARPVPGYGPVYALTADPARHRLLLVNEGTGQGHSPRVEALDPATLAVTRGAELPLIKETIAVVGGRVWLGGYATAEAQRLYRIDPDTLQVDGASEVDDQVGPGAILSAGAGSLWVRGGGDESLYCVDPVTGGVRQRWRSGAETVASLPRVALGVNGHNLVQLVLTGDCPG
jgi:hypothetical protein